MAPPDMRLASSLLVAALAFAVALACGGATSLDKPGPSCTYVDASACNSPAPSYASDVSPLLDRACNATCHVTGVGPWPLTNYGDVSDWASIIAGDVEKCTMPPADAGAGTPKLTDSERVLLLNRIACGAPNN